MRLLLSGDGISPNNLTMPPDDTDLKTGSDLGRVLLVSARRKS
jgi:hypothetical protein